MDVLSISVRESPYEIFPVACIVLPFLGWREPMLILKDHDHSSKWTILLDLVVPGVLQRVLDFHCVMVGRFFSVIFVFAAW